MKHFTIKDGETVGQVADRAKKKNVVLQFGPLGADALTYLKVGDTYINLTKDLQVSLTEMTSIIDDLKQRVVQKRDRDDNFVTRRPTVVHNDLF